MLFSDPEYGHGGQLYATEFGEDGEGLYCQIESESILDVFVKCPLGFNYVSSDDKYQIFFLRSASIVENDIFQVYDKSREQRIGWCFPASSLGSLEHDYSDNEHFLAYAQTAIVDILFSRKSFNYEFNMVDFGFQDINISNLFGEDVSILVVSMDVIEEQDPYLSKWLPSLHGYGYTLWSISNYGVRSFGEKPENIRMNLDKINEDLYSNPFIYNLFVHLLPASNTNLVMFFYYYQIVELLVENVYEKEEYYLIYQLCQGSPGYQEKKDVLYQWKSLAKDSFILPKLFNEYMNHLSYGPLKEVCNEFLEKCGRGREGELWKSLYGVRNKVFHEYRNIPNDNTLENVILELSKGVPLFLSNFSK